LPAAFCAAALAFGFSGCTNGETKRATNLVSLEAANSAGPSPWMDSITSGDLPSTVNRVEDTSIGSPDSHGGIQTVWGDKVGLYAGSTSQAVCDRNKLVDFLERNPADAHAWLTVFGISDIRAYVITLSPVRLTQDTRVTDYRFENSQTAPFQSVLQTGTAVMIDGGGIPRVRCNSGSPLTEPQTNANEEYTGNRWQGLDTNPVVKVQKSDTPIENLTLVALPTRSATLPSKSTTGAAPAPDFLVEMPVGKTVARPAPHLVLPPGETLVPVEVTPPLNSTTSSVQVSTSRTTTAPTTTTTSTTRSSVSSSSISTTRSATSSVPVTPGGVQTTNAPKVQEQQDTSLPGP
jgi:hypothetical protein